ncbi:hypothetical protein A3E15_02535 [Candidatus Woesebacteria bacterium RIFCSPHIGHO2_12_FULL_42_9]|uniref:Uncharacterized protein n=3 Tax=Candidatus Woeseibacteriota TaxID=1752722 RepID=A0A1F8ASM0_9BACT|nr:MAG: hypothetical protein A2112_01990 [Candidatus Woesebacteria bacterium GWA1_42_12]OGM07285.1 MAG: hypothetical protein A2129_02565 [Candidatus Woesebacteria bacterium GWC1_42_13]OGM54640.1 MAG: hypothetical protein A3E15_02535 [Candidatus Woesebacteria bacterium RIFCSPHIGHO2_12_FULL_42_9]
MPREVDTEALARRRTFIPLILNRAALGTAEYVFAVMESVDSEPNHVAYVPRKDIRVREQPITGDEFHATLEVDIVEDHGRYYLVETEREEGSKVRFKVNKEQGKVEPFRHRAIFES